MRLTKWEYMEPLLSNRWVIKIEGINIETSLFRRYKIFNDGDKLMFSCEICETVIHQINPKDFFNIDSIKIEFLGPTGVTINGFSFNPKGLLFEQVGDYSSDDLLTYKILIEINKDTFLKSYKNERIGNE